MRNYNLCKPCAEAKKAKGYTVKMVSHSVDQKIICRACKKRRFGATYEVTK